jgi:hypothetical protein
MVEVGGTCSFPLFVNIIGLHTRLRPANLTDANTRNIVQCGAVQIEFHHPYPFMFRSESQSAEDTQTCTCTGPVQPSSAPKKVPRGCVRVRIFASNRARAREESFFFFVYLNSPLTRFFGGHELIELNRLAS